MLSRRPYAVDARRLLESLEDVGAAAAGPRERPCRAGSVPIHETDLQLAYRIEQYQAARDRRQCCLNDIEREGRVATRLGECTLKLEELYQEARLAVRDAVS